MKKKEEGQNSSKFISKNRKRARQQNGKAILGLFVSEPMTNWQKSRLEQRDICSSDQAYEEGRECSKS